MSYSDIYLLNIAIVNIIPFGLLAAFIWVIYGEVVSPLIFFGKPKSFISNTEIIWFIPIYSCEFFAWFRRKYIYSVNTAFKITANFSSSKQSITSIWNDLCLNCIAFSTYKKPYNFPFLRRRNREGKCRIEVAPDSVPIQLNADTDIEVELNISCYNRNIANHLYKIKNHGRGITNLEIIQSEKSVPFRFLVLGMMFFSFSGTMLAMNLSSLPAQIMIWSSAIISLFLVVALIIRICLEKYLINWRYFQESIDWLTKCIKPVFYTVAELIYFMGFYLTWFEGFKESQTIFLLIFWLGIAWIFIFLIIIARRVPTLYSNLIALLLWLIGLYYLYTEQYISSVFVLLTGILIFVNGMRWCFQIPDEEYLIF